MSFLPGQAVVAASPTPTYDGEGRPVGTLAAGVVARIAGARTSLVTSAAWFWAWPISPLDDPALIAWAPESALSAATSEYVGGLGDVTVPGILVPPIGLQQLLRPSGVPGSSRGAARAAELPPPPPSGVNWTSVGAKVAVIALGAVAAYLIYVATRNAGRMQKDVGRVTGRVLRARVGLPEATPPRRSHDYDWEYEPPPPPRQLPPLFHGSHPKLLGP